MEIITGLIDKANGFLWNWPADAPLMVIALLGTGIFLTFRLRFINIRGFKHAINVVRGVYDDPNDPGDISHFQALTTALSATVGIGNIAGVATAIHYGGPGAIFWMWVTAVFGMTSKFTECTLALEYRTKNTDGSVSGGPMYYIEKGLGPRFKPLAIFVAVATVICSFGTGNSIQAFTMADSFRSQFGLPTWLTGGLAAAAVAAVILGGISRIASFTSRIMPAMAGLYFAGAIVILFLNLGEIPAAFTMIISSAFNPQAALGGFAGATFVYMLTWGVKRGIFSNEAGQGSAPIAHAAARTDEPVREGSVALLEPSIDTLLICTITGLVIITTGVWTDKKQDMFPVNSQSNIAMVSQQCELGTNATTDDTCFVKLGKRFTVTGGNLLNAKLVINHGLVDSPILQRAGKPFEGTAGADEQGRLILFSVDNLPVKDAKLIGNVLQNGSPLTAWAFERGLARIVPMSSNVPWGSHLVTFCVFLFALSTAIGWSYYGDRSIQYLFGNAAITPYRWIFCAMHFVGAIVPLEVVWGFGDAALAMMTLPNLFAMVAMSGKVVQLTNTYFAKNHVRYVSR